MATITKTASAYPHFGGAPYSNSYSRSFQLQTNASGVLADSDGTAAIAIADIVRLGVIPGGTEMQSVLACIGDAFTALTTFKLGFAYVDGVDDTAVPQNDAHFFAAGAVSSAIAVLASTALTSPVTINKDAYLILTNAGAAHASVGRADFVLFGRNRGTK